MWIDEIHDRDSPDGSEGLLALIVRGPPNEWQPGVTFVTDRNQQQQVAFIAHPPGYVVPAHRHLPVERRTVGTQEVLLVRSGSAMLEIFNSTGTPIRKAKLGAGDVVVLLAGGHEITMLTACEFVEVKAGPYVGKEQDKTPLQVIRNES